MVLNDQWSSWKVVSGDTLALMKLGSTQIPNRVKSGKHRLDIIIHLSRDTYKKQKILHEMTFPNPSKANCKIE